MTNQKGLLPTGLRDVLPPEAAFEARIIERLADFFAANGYDRVKPPLIEFEETLLSGSGSSIAIQVFQFMDPLSQRMMGIRADITPQIGRIAATRLVNAHRPLRLSYAGSVLRVNGTQLRPERQSTQVGIELIGSNHPRADAEIVLLVTEALEELGVTGVSIDLNLPTLVPTVMNYFNIRGIQAKRLQQALDHKDATTLAIDDMTGLLGALLAACGPANYAVKALLALDLPPPAAAERTILAQTVTLIQAEAPNLIVTVDPVEHRGFEYHAGVSFSIFARNVQGELGRGGRYHVGTGEPAVGATLFVDVLLEILDRPVTERKLLLPVGTARAMIHTLRDAGWVTIAAIDPEEDLIIAAKRLQCTHVLYNGEPTLLDL